MASFYMKSLGVLVIFAAVFISLGAGADRFRIPPIRIPPIRGPRPPIRVPPIRRPPIRVPPRRIHDPPIPFPNPPPPRMPLMHTTNDQSAREFGESLANKYFGDKTIKGFRWGYKQGKRVHSVPRKCEDFVNVLKDSSCPQSLQSVFPRSSNTIVHCIVEVSNYSGMNGKCIQVYESSQYPPEATCVLDQPNTLGSKCTA